MRGGSAMLYERIAPWIDLNKGELMLLILFILTVAAVWAWDNARYYHIRVIRIGKYRFARKAK
jgi:hypothetical protein